MAFRTARLKAIVLAGSILTTLFFIMPASAYAHSDFQIADGAFEVAAGRFREFVLPVHFHRIVGSFEVVRPVGGTVNVHVMDDQSFVKYAGGELAPRLYSSGETRSGTLNFLIGCCYDWTVVDPKTEPSVIIEEVSTEYDRLYFKHHLVIDNTNSFESKTVRLKASLIHDGAAVLVYSGEEFVILEVGIFFGVVAVGLGLYVRKKIRQAKNFSIPDRKMKGKVLVFAVASLVVSASTVVLGLSLALMGSSSYGGSLLEGFAASAADLPARRLLFAVVFVPWLLAVLLWMKAFSTTATMGSRLVGSIGLMQGISPVFLALLTAFDYGFPHVTTLFGGVGLILISSIFGLPQMMGGLYLVKRSQKLNMLRQ